MYVQSRSGLIILSKTPIILKALNPTLDGYRSKISDLGPRLETFDLKRLIDHLTDKTEITAEEINVIKFGREMIDVFADLIF